MTTRFRALGITKRFGATVALDDVSLDLEGGHVHVLLGANGAGKSTLLGILAGALRADQGTMERDGAVYAPRSPAAARSQGVAIVAQEPVIVPELSVEANVMLGAERTYLGFVDRSQHAVVARAALARLGHGELDLGRRAGLLPLSLRHVVVIARALVQEPRVVVLDEPTSTLSAEDAAHVIAAVRELAGAGVAVLYVTHFLGEVARVGDSYSVLCDGRVVAAGDARRMPASVLAEHVSGRAPAAPAAPAPRQWGDVVLSVTGLSGREFPRELDLFVSRGQVMGFYGLAGSGRSALMRTIFGADARVKGEVRVDGKVLGKGPQNGVRAGLGLLALERSSNLFLGRTVAEQVTIARLGPTSFAGFTRAARVREAARAALRFVSAAHVDTERRIEELSGGTQQRVALARLVHQAPEVLLLEEPTRGVDAAARQDILRLVDELAKSGRAVLIASSAEDELLAACDTIAVLRAGRIVESRAASAWSPSELVHCASGGGEAA